MSNYPAFDWPPVVDEIRAALPDGTRAWLAGGAVRDALLNRRLHDLDFAVDRDGVAVARAVAKALDAPYFALDAERGVGRLFLERDGARLEVDFARLREPEIAADLVDRDFTINAMAVDLADPQVLIDPTGGLADLRAKIIRACTPNAIANDPVRAIRAVRLAAQFDFRLDKDTRAQVRAQSARLPETAAERRRDEFLRCLNGPRPAAALRALDLLGLLDHLAPELLPLKGLTQPPPHAFDAWDHTLMVVTRLRDVLTVLSPVYDLDSASEVTLGLVSFRLGRHRQALGAHLQAHLEGDRPVRALLMTAAAFHDVGKAETRQDGDDGQVHFRQHGPIGAAMTARRLGAMRFSNDEIRRARTVIAHHLRPLQLADEPEVTRRAIYRYFRDTGEAGVDIALLALADFLGTYGDGPPPVDKWNKLLDVCVSLLGAYFERPEEAVRPPTLLTGHDLMAEFGLPPGPQLGELLEAVREAQAAGEISDREAALSFVRERLSAA